MILAFTGPSSSGKSTLLKRIKKSSFSSDNEIVIKKEDNFITILVLKNILGNKPFSEYKRTKFFEKKQRGILKVFSFFVNFFYPILVYIEFVLEYFYYEVLFKKKILMRDRYIYDYLVTFKDILNISNKPMETLYKNFPKPTLLFYVSVNKDTLIQRNKNNIPNKITAKESLIGKVLKNYDKIAKTKNILTIDNNGPMENSVNNILFHISAKNKISKIRSIAIIGLDGSGKTTLAKNICNYANKLNMKCRIIHFYHDNVLYKLLKTFGFFNSDEVTIPKESVNRKKSSLWALLTWIDSYMQYLFATLFFGNDLIVYDRYFYDYLVTFDYLGIKKISFLKTTIPAVDYKLLLACEPSIALKRKPENILDFFVLGSKEYAQLAKTYNMKVIDSTSKTNEAVFKQFLYDVVKNDEL